MQQNIKSSICVRLTPKCRDSVQLVSKNASCPKQIRLINRNSNDFVLYEFDQIYGKDTTNQFLYESMIFTQGVNTMLDLQSGLYCFLGSQGVGKTYTVTGQLNNVWENCGLLGYLMQDFFDHSAKIPTHAKLSPSQFNPAKLSSSQSNSNALQLRFLQILGDNVENIGFQTVYGQSTNQRQLGNRIDYKIDIKSLAHFQNCINKIYQRKKPHMHLVIEVTLKNQPLIYNTKKTTLTFIQISSACFDQGNAHAHKIKSQVEALITIFQNIQRIKHLQHLFESSKLTKLLKNNFFQAKKICLVGILDNSFKGNSMTLKWLKMSLQFKEDKTIIESMKEDIKKQEEYLKNLMQKHKKAMTLLSKCIGTQLSFLEKQKNFVTSKRQIDFGFGSSFNKRCEKIKLANMKKQQNSEQIQKLNKQISGIQQQIDFMECEHKDSMKKFQEQRNEIICVKNKLIAKMLEMTQQLLYTNVLNGNGIGSNSGNSLFWRPTLNFQNTAAVLEAGSSKKKGSKDYDSTIVKKQHTSRNSSFKLSAKKINNNSIFKPSNSNVVLSPSITKIERKQINQQEDQQNLRLEIKRQQSLIKQQTRRQIYELFKLISEQQKYLQSCVKQNFKNISTGVINKIKSRQEQGLRKIPKQVFEKYLREGKQFELNRYNQFAYNQDVFTNISKQLNSKEKNTSKTIVTNVGRT